MRLKNKRIIITGATGGIGTEASKMFHAEGAKLILADLNEDIGMNLTRNLEGSEFVKTDVTDAESVAHLFNRAKERFGGLDGLFHTAGIESSYGLLDCNDSHFDRVISVHLKGTFLCLRAAANAMLKSGGSIVLTASQRGILGARGSLAYNSAKGGIVIMGKSAALELGQYGIRVNVLCPGATDTPMLRRDMANQSDPEKVLKEMLCNYPLGRLGTAREVAYGALYLISDESSFVTGTTLVIDGGNTAG